MSVNAAFFSYVIQTRINNNSNEKWYWGYPQCFGISVNGTCYLRVTTVIGGQESAPSESIKITK